jgi:hypothetical protein
MWGQPVVLNRQQDIPYLNVNLLLSQRLLDLTTKERPY